MYLNTPRIAPLPESEWNAEQRELAAPLVQRGNVLNIFRTLLRHPSGMRGFMAWGNHVLSRKNTLSSRERELVILRTGFLCKSGDQWTQHLRIGLRAGLTEAEIPAIKVGATAPNWTPAESALLAATDDLHHRQFVSPANWSALKAHFSDTQCMDVVFTAGQYTQVSMMLNTFGVQLDEGQVLDPDLDQRSKANGP